MSTDVEAALSDRQISYFLQVSTLREIQEGHSFDLLSSPTGIINRVAQSLSADERIRLGEARKAHVPARPVVCKQHVIGGAMQPARDRFGVCFLIREGLTVHPAYALIGELCCGAIFTLGENNTQDVKIVFGLLQELECAKNTGRLPDLSLNMTHIDTPYGVTPLPKF